jgi:hypothetical protein
LKYVRSIADTAYVCLGGKMDVAIALPNVRL